MYALARDAETIQSFNCGRGFHSVVAIVVVGLPDTAPRTWHPYRGDTIDVYARSSRLEVSGCRKAIIQSPKQSSLAQPCDVFTSGRSVLSMCTKDKCRRR